MVSALNRSLYFKQSIATLLLAIILSVVLSFFQAYQSIQQEPYRIQKEFNDTLSIVERPLSQALFRLDTVFAQQQAESLLYNPAIQKVTVTDENGRIFAEASAPDIEPSLSDDIANYLIQDSLVVSRELNFSEIEIPLGRVELELDRRYLVEQVVRVNNQRFVQNLFKDVLLASILSLLFYGMVTRPLKQLTWSLTRLDNKRTVSVPALFDKIHRNDELGRLKSTFNELWQRLSNALDALERSHQHSKAMIKHAADGIIVLDKNYNIRLVNEAAAKLVHMPIESLTNQPMTQLPGGSFWTSLRLSLEELAVDQVMNAETALSSHQCLVPIEIRINKYVVQGETEIVLLMRDLSERKEAQQRINHLSYYDSLTRLPNRTLMNDHLQRAMDDMAQGRFGVLIILDLDRFKTINDALGHNVGDQLLLKVVDSLIPLVPLDTTFARMGGDEFVFLWSNVRGSMNENNVSVVNFMQRILRVCAEVKHVEGHDLHVTGSLGVSFFDGSEESTATVVRQADTALYKAKELGRNTFAFFQEDMQSLSDARLQMEKSLYRALKENEFEVYYQPQHNDKGEVIGAEALLRWNEPDRGFIPPMEFIPIAEDIGLIHELGRFVLLQTTLQVAGWYKQGLWQDNWRISINVSPMQFAYSNLLQDITDALANSGLSASMVDIEITETALMSDLERALEIMEQIRELGVSLSVDDFGTGYSSLKYLKDLPIDRLKIDQSFVRDLITDKNDYAIVLAVIAMANALSLKVLAEGVETEEHFKQLELMGCYTYQGYYFGRPCNATDFAQNFLKAGHTA
ncbi:putative bifunctional diguanylate cyclase/phosphodiesterase [Marinomonas fungiae]|uniref:PAS domain S-box/diguanylate cyclase (GGDEF) domain n=1 Tax=Marinomonas fungiae TaxID=1137284 RepID=A0A0K6IHM9_9GAMM|nr:EAL domain-containing protein [Marinomonas fungiae]CUB02605.1 PAS domain S-box/diguanylate cyclase (GGDEF) domain [Marinomonas fungiae]